jgi:hypothetical protein
MKKYGGFFSMVHAAWTKNNLKFHKNEKFLNYIIVRVKIPSPLQIYQ